MPFHGLALSCNILCTSFVCLSSVQGQESVVVVAVVSSIATLTLTLAVVAGVLLIVRYFFRTHSNATRRVLIDQTSNTKAQEEKPDEGRSQRRALWRLLRCQR